MVIKIFFSIFHNPSQYLLQFSCSSDESPSPQSESLSQTHDKGIHLLVLVHTNCVGEQALRKQLSLFSSVLSVQSSPPSHIQLLGIHRLPSHWNSSGLQVFFSEITNKKDFQLLNIFNISMKYKGFNQPHTSPVDRLSSEPSTQSLLPSHTNCMSTQRSRLLHWKCSEK